LVFDMHHVDLLYALSLAAAAAATAGLRPGPGQGRIRMQRMHLLDWLKRPS
jgi:hypothetical protein